MTHETKASLVEELLGEVLVRGVGHDVVELARVLPGGRRVASLLISGQELREALESAERLARGPAEVRPPVQGEPSEPQDALSEVIEW